MNHSPMIAKEKSGLSLFEWILILFFAAVYLLPAVNKMLPETLTLMIIVFYLLLLAFGKNGLQKPIFLLLFLSLWIAACYFLLTETVTISSDVTNAGFKRIFSKMNQVLRMFFPVVLAMRTLGRANRKQKLWLFAISCVFMVYVMVITIREIAINPSITRSWGATEALEQADANVAGYYFVYAIPVIISALIIGAFKLKRAWLKVFCIVATVFCFIFLVEAQYTLALLISLIGCMLAFFTSLKNVWAKTITLIVFVLLFIFVADLLTWLSSVVTHEQMSLRLEELAAFFASGDSSGYNLNGRFELYGKSIKAFFDSPLWGNKKLDFDGHATFLTVFADTGILGGIPYMALVFYARKQIKETLGESGGLFLVPFIQFLLMGFTNPIHPAFALGFSVWFVVPTMIHLIHSKKEPREGEK